jgi:hypothetical protein
MDGHNRFRLRCNFFLDLRRIHGPGIPVTIHKNRDTPIFHHGKGTGDNGKAWQDHFITGFDPQTVNCHIEGGGAIADRDPEFFPAVRGPTGFEFVDKFPR